MRHPITPSASSVCCCSCCEFCLFSSGLFGEFHETFSAFFSVALVFHSRKGMNRVQCPRSKRLNGWKSWLLSWFVIDVEAFQPNSGAERTIAVHEMRTHRAVSVTWAAAVEGNSIPSPEGTSGWSGRPKSNSLQRTVVVVEWKFFIYIKRISSFSLHVVNRAHVKHEKMLYGCIMLPSRVKHSENLIHSTQFRVISLIMYTKCRLVARWASAGRNTTPYPTSSSIVDGIFSLFFDMHLAVQTLNSALSIFQLALLLLLLLLASARFEGFSAVDTVKKEFFLLILHKFPFFFIPFIVYCSMNNCKKNEK